MSFSEKFIQFVIHHWALVTSFVVLLILLFIEESRSKGMGKAIPTHEVVRLINHEKAIILDIRSDHDFSEGHIVKAKHILRHQIDGHLDQLSSFKQCPIVVICEQAQLSMQIVGKLRRLGFEKVYFLSGGMRAWQQAGMPVQKGKRSSCQK